MYSRNVFAAEPLLQRYTLAAMTTRRWSMGDQILDLDLSTAGKHSPRYPLSRSTHLKKKTPPSNVEEETIRNSSCCSRADVS